MAWVALENKVKEGFLVYEAYNPQNPGIIRKIVKDEMVAPFANQPAYMVRRVIVEVEWLKETKRKKKATVQALMGLCDFEELIEEHRRKYESQSKMAEKLR